MSHLKQYSLGITSAYQESLHSGVISGECTTDEVVPVVMATYPCYNATAVRMDTQVSFIRDDSTECKSWRVMAQFRMIGDVLTKVGPTLELDIMGDAGCVPTVAITSDGLNIVATATGEVGKVLKGHITGMAYFATPEDA